MQICSQLSQRTENGEREGSRGHGDVAEWNKRHVEEVVDRHEGTLVPTVSAMKGNVTQQMLVEFASDNLRCRKRRSSQAKHLIQVSNRMRHGIERIW